MAVINILLTSPELISLRFVDLVYCEILSVAYIVCDIWILVHLKWLTIFRDLLKTQYEEGSEYQNLNP
jgi:hypothetical protein